MAQWIETLDAAKGTGDSQPAMVLSGRLGVTHKMGNLIEPVSKGTNGSLAPRYRE